MAWYRWAFESVGGFDPEYHKAGDDVDFCWRVQQEGHNVAFSPTAIVWHHRRFTLNAFAGNNKVTASGIDVALQTPGFLWPDGTAKWRGQIYGTPRFSWFISRRYLPWRFRRRIFPTIYPTPQSEVAAYLSSIEWFALTVFLLAWEFFSSPAHCALPHVWWNVVRGHFLHVARAHRTEVRHHSRALARDVLALPSHSLGVGRVILHGCILSAHRARSFGLMKPADAGAARAKTCAVSFTGAKRARTGISFDLRAFGPGRRRMALFHRHRME